MMFSTTRQKGETMSRLGLLNRVITVAALVVLAVALDAWLTRAPMTAATSAVVTPAEPASVETLPEPTLAPLPAATTTTEMKVEVEIAPLPILPAPVSVAVNPPPVPVAKRAEVTAKPQSVCKPRRRGLFRQW
jgi:hypothetical protein